MTDNKPSRWKRRLRRTVLALVALNLLAVAGCALCFQGPYLPPEALPDEPILDMHCHTAGMGQDGSGCFVSETLRESYKFGFYLRAFGVTRSDANEMGDAVLIDHVADSVQQSEYVGRAIILAMDGAVDESGELDRSRTEFYVPNEFVARETARHTNLLYGASINPYRNDALERLDRAHANGAVLIKWLPSVQLIDPADKRLIPFYRRMAELKLPLLTHTGAEKSFTWANDEFADPERLKLPLEQGVTVIAAHAASTGKHENERDIDRLARLMDDYPNLYADISSLTQINKLGYLKEVLQRSEFEGHLIYGTDFPLINTLLVSPFYFPLNLTPAQMWRISRIENPWDRDVALKQALGVPAAVFDRSAKMFGNQREASNTAKTPGQ